MLDPLFKANGRCPQLNIECTLVAGLRIDISNPRRQDRFSSKSNQLTRGLYITTYDGFIESLEKPYTIDISTLDKIKCVGYRNQSFFEKEI